jgi:YbbR domain-containing protein
MDRPRTILENWPIKLASLLLAVTLWFYVTSKGKTEVSVSVPLELRNIPAAMVVVGDVPARLDVRLQGQERALRDIAAGRKAIGVVDLGRGREGDNVVHLAPEDIVRPAGVAVTHLSPYEITVTLERLVRKTVRLVPVTQGRPAAGLRLVSVGVRPARVTVEGPSSAVHTIAELRTLPLDITGLTERTVVEPRIDFQGKPLKVLEQDISVTIVIQKERP